MSAVWLWRLCGAWERERSVRAHPWVLAFPCPPPRAAGGGARAPSRGCMPTLHSRGALKSQHPPPSPALHHLEPVQMDEQKKTERFVRTRDPVPGPHTQPRRGAQRSGNGRAVLPGVQTGLPVFLFVWSLVCCLSVCFHWKRPGIRGIGVQSRAAGGWGAGASVLGLCCLKFCQRVLSSVCIIAFL